MILMDAVILKFIVNNGGAAVTGDLLFNLCDATTFLRIINGDEKFVSCSVGGTPKVVVRSRVRLCRVRECPGCAGLHLCKNFLLSGACHFSQRRRGCLFSHDLDSSHNMEVLRANGLETLTRAELCLLLLQSDPTLLPQICYNYNNDQCRDGCHRLHICEKFAACSCPRTHDFSAPQPLKILQEKQIPEHLMSSLKSVYANKDVLRFADKKAGRNGNEGSSLAKRSFSCGDLLGAVDVEVGGDGAGRVNQRQRDKTEICMYFIKGHCKHEDRCFKAHDKMPYRWEIRRGRQWTALAENETIEKDYSDPQKVYSTSSPPVYFDTMTCGTEDVRRLSTVNSVLQPDFIHTTDWLWYWEDEYGVWNQYAAVSSEHRMASITSKDLEEMYLRKDTDAVEFSAGSQKYSLSFQDMIQTNLKHGTKRLVRRRPRFVSAAEVQNTRKRPANSTAVPDYWDKTQISQTGYKRVTVPPASEEYKEIQQLFSQTMTDFNLVQIERIQNKALWEAFQLQKNHMKNNNGRKPVLEKKLFHGTDPKYVDAICATNFDWRVCGLNGTSFGQGSYFARDAKYSHRYTGDSDPRFMFVSRVLVGEFARGSSEYRRPPSRDGGDVNLFDSCVNNIDNPSIFVVFEKHQIYPEYLLQYEQPSVADTRLNEALTMSRRLTMARVANPIAAILDQSNPRVDAPILTPIFKPEITHTKPLQRSETVTKPGVTAKPLTKRDVSKAGELALSLSAAVGQQQTGELALSRGAMIKKLKARELALSRAAAIEKLKTGELALRRSATIEQLKARERAFPRAAAVEKMETGERALWRSDTIEQPKPRTLAWLRSAAVEQPKTVLSDDSGIVYSEPKRVVIPSCFTSSERSSSHSVVSSSRSSTPASYSYLQDWVKK